MPAIRLFSVLAVFLSMTVPISASAALFGLTPSVFEEQLASGERVSRFVEIVRANPDEETHLLVSKRNDPTGAVLLVSGDRIVLPLGQESVKYEFVVDASRIDTSGVLDAGIEFLNEEMQNGSGGAKVRLGGVIKVRMTVSDEVVISPQDLNLTESASPSVRDRLGAVFSFVRDPGVFLLAPAVIALLICVALLAKGRRKHLQVAAFFVSFATCMALVGGWVIFGGQAGIDVWKNSEDARVRLDDGLFFLLASDTLDGLFLNPSAGNSQSIEGDWLYFATFNDRVFIVPATPEQRDLYRDRIFRFNESMIQPYGSKDIPGIITGVRENVWGTYAVFSGERDIDGTAFWCMANVWDQEVLSCVFLDKLIKEPILSVSFSQTQKQIAMIHSAKRSYQFDAWKRSLVPLEMSVEDTDIEPFEFLQPLAQEGVKARWGFVVLDEKRIFAPGERKYFSLAPFIWLESVETTSVKKVFIVDTRSFTRKFLTDIPNESKLYWLQKGGFITSP